MEKENTVKHLTVHEMLKEKENEEKKIRTKYREILDNESLSYEERITFEDKMYEEYEKVEKEALNKLSVEERQRYLKELEEAREDARREWEYEYSINMCE